MPGSAQGQGTKGLCKTENDLCPQGVYLLVGGKVEADIKYSKHILGVQINAEDKNKVGNGRQRVLGEEVGNCSFKQSGWQRTCQYVSRDLKQVEDLVNEPSKYLIVTNGEQASSRVLNCLAHSRTTRRPVWPEWSHQ